MTGRPNGLGQLIKGTIKVFFLLAFILSCTIIFHKKSLVVEGFTTTTTSQYLHTHTSSSHYYPSSSLSKQEELRISSSLTSRKQLPHVRMAATTPTINTDSHTPPSTSNNNNKIYDLIVIGGGSAGLTAAKFCGSTLKKSCLLIEQDAQLGGDCTWSGCVPSKSLLASAKAAQLVRSTSTTTSTTTTTWPQVQRRFQNIQQEIYEKDDSPEVLQKMGVETLTGRATLVSSHTVQVELMDVEGGTTGRTIRMEANQGVILCTGASPKPAEQVIPGLDTVKYVTYEGVWFLQDLPKKLTVVGGGPIGCELAQAFSRLGSQVTMVASKLLPREEPEVSAILERVFQEEGIRLVKDRLESVSPSDTEGAHSATTKNGQQVVEGDLLLVSIGRTPNTKGMGLEDLGIGLDGGIQVNDQLETACRGVYAAGDCTGEKQFTHYAGYQGAIAARNILLPLSDPGVLSEIPASTFTSPEIASLGMTEAQARNELGDAVVAVSKMNLDEVDRALCEGHRDGILKVVYHKRSGKILGATIMAPAAGELISELAVVKSAGMSFDALAKVIHPYPSYAMALQLMAADVYYEKTTKMLWLYNFLKWLGL